MSITTPPEGHDYRLADTWAELVSQAHCDPQVRQGHPRERRHRAEAAVRERSGMERTIETSGMTPADQRAALAQLWRLRSEGAPF